MLDYLNRCWNEEMDVKYHNTPSRQKPGSTQKCMDRYEIARFDTSPIWDIWHPWPTKCYGPRDIGMGLWGWQIKNANIGMEPVISTEVEYEGRWDDERTQPRQLKYHCTW